MPERRTLLLRSYAWRERRGALLRSAGYNLRTLPPWFVMPLGGIKQASVNFMASLFTLSIDGLDPEAAAMLDAMRRGMPRPDWFRPFAEFAKP